MSYYLSVIKDSPSGFWKLDESTGSVAYDSSGCGNDGQYFGSILNTTMPIVCGGQTATKITNTNYILKIFLAYKETVALEQTKHQIMIFL
jgi:hypothetical protein